MSTTPFDFAQNPLMILGAPKCGTTSLAVHLSEHPEIAFSNPKEPHYFSKDYPFGPNEIDSLEAYEGLFPISTSTKIIAEGSVLYLFSDEAVQRIEEYSNHSAKYLVCLRNPAIASFSLHAQNISLGWEKEADFVTALKRGAPLDSKSELSAKTNKVLNYARLYRYAPHISRLLETVEPDRVMFFVLERDSQNLQDFYNNLHEFSGVSARKVPYERRANEARRIRYLPLYRVLTSKPGLAVARFLRRVIKPDGFGLGRPILEMSAHQKALALDLFHADILTTAEIVGFDPNLWLKQPQS